MEKISSIKRTFYIPIIWVALVWIIESLEVALGWNFVRFGVRPLNITYLSGILTSPMIHGDWNHLINNTPPLFVLSSLIIMSYRKIAFSALSAIYLLSGLILWLFPLAVGSFHIGASGVIYGMASFLFFSGLFRRDIKSMALALIVAFLYGSLIWGIFPGKPGISWEGHLSGGVAGFLVAYMYRKKLRPPKLEWEDEVIKQKTFETFIKKIDDQPRRLNSF